jgi:hypothetical protein
MAAFAFAQPQAPITWGQIRLLQQAPDTLQCRDIYAHGDTLVLLGFRPVDGEHIFAAASVSGDNGSTWSPWNVFWPNDQSIGNATASVTSQGVYALAEDPTQNAFGFYHSTNLGQSWSPPPAVYYLGLRALAELGDTIFCSAGYDSVTWTANGGLTLAPRRQSYARPYSQGQTGIRSLDVSSSRVHTFAVGNVQGDFHWRVLYSAASLLEGVFSPVLALNANIYGVYATDGRFDRDGTGVLASIVMYHLPLPDWGDVVVNITRDDGLTWSPPDTITTGVSADPFYVYVRHSGPLWAVAWWDSSHVAPYVHGGGWTRFSANWGRSWYPIQQAFDGHEVFGGDFCEADLRPDYIRLYETMSYWNNIPGWYYFEWEGEIHADSLSPIIQPMDLPPDTVSVQAQLVYLATITDNDTLSQEQLRVRSATDTLSIPMTWTGTDYLAQWTVPQAGRYFYRIEGEDFWENVGSYPDSGWAMLVTPGWIDNATDVILSPSSFSLSLYPNPSNGWPMLTLAPEWIRQGPATIAVYNVLGQRFSEVNVTKEIVRLGGEREAGTGIYFARVTNGQRTEVVKFLIVK